MATKVEATEEGSPPSRIDEGNLPCIHRYVDDCIVRHTVREALRFRKVDPGIPRILLAGGDIELQTVSYYCHTCPHFHSYLNGIRTAAQTGQRQAPTFPLKCPRCNRDITLDARFCEACGQPLGQLPIQRSWR